MKYLKRYESNDFDIKKEYLSDLLSDANLNGVSFKWHFSSDITVYIKSKIPGTLQEQTMNVLVFQTI